MLKNQVKYVYFRLMSFSGEVTYRRGCITEINELGV